MRLRRAGCAPQPATVVSAHGVTRRTSVCTRKGVETVPAGEVACGTVPMPEPEIVKPNTPNIMSVDKSAIISQFQLTKTDTGSAEVQIALLSARIAHLTEHLRTHKKDVHSRRGLLMMTNRRRKLLNYLKKSDLPKYNDIIVKLGLRK